MSGIELANNNGKIDRFDINSSNEELIKKLRKLFKSRKLSKLGLKPSKSENLPKFVMKKT